MKHIKRLSVFEDTQELNQEQIDFLDFYTYGKWRVNPSTGLVDIKGTFSCSAGGLDSFKGIKFGKVSRSFSCHNNILASLEGAPEEVGENFTSHMNRLLSLEGGPKKVGGTVTCHNNSLTSLEGSPKEVGGYFMCYSNPLDSLKGAPEKIGLGFDCGAFEVKGDLWGPEGWSEILKNADQEKRDLILTLPFFGDPNYLQKEIEKNPGKCVIGLREVWNLKEFKHIRDQLKVSDQFLKDIGDQSTLSDLGF